MRAAKDRSCYAPPKLAAAFTEARASEVNLDEIGAYYGVPSLSVRKAFGAAAGRAFYGDPFFRPWELTRDGDIFYCDFGCASSSSPS